MPRSSVELANDGERLTVIVTDDGVGPPEGFSVESSTGLGLSIVRTLVTSELAGTIDFHAGDGPGRSAGHGGRALRPGPRLSTSV